MNQKKSFRIVQLVIFSCLIMALVDAVIQPGYLVKSLIKVTLFLCVPLLYARYDKDCDFKQLFRVERKQLVIAVCAGVGLYVLILLAYFCFRSFFDFSAVTSNLMQDVGVNRGNFLYVALYISFMNSLLEEFYFRGFAYLILCNYLPQRTASGFSALTFACYHIAILLGWFPFQTIALAILALFIGGLFFNHCDKQKTIYPSWLLHMAANFAINTIGLILFDIIG